MPKRFLEFAEKSSIPEKEALEKASEHIFGSTQSEEYYENYNNLIFLEKKKKNS